MSIDLSISSVEEPVTVLAEVEDTMDWSLEESWFSLKALLLFVMSLQDGLWNSFSRRTCDV